MKSLKYWAFLGVSILLEVSGTSIMKLSQSSSPLLGMVIMYILLAVSYYFLSLAIKRLPLGVACAFWESIGLVLIAVVGVIVLKEKLSTMQLLALGLVLGGSMLVNHGTSSGKKEKVKAAVSMAGKHVKSSLPQKNNAKAMQSGTAKAVNVRPKSCPLNTASADI